MKQWLTSFNVYTYDIYALKIIWYQPTIIVAVTWKGKHALVVQISPMAVLAIHFT